ncbi:MAG: hypothetical protein ABIG03_00180 [Candidatus Eisenbacteria bacterium]
MRRKPFYITFAVSGVLGLVLFAVGFGLTAGLVSVADDFFGALSHGDYDSAYAYLSSEFHGNTSIAELRTFAQESALAEYSAATWWQRTVDGDCGYLDGEVETRNGTYVPVTLTLLKEDDVWRIYQIDWGEEESDLPENLEAITSPGD